jgi:hypothetical protein
MHHVNDLAHKTATLLARNPAVGKTGVPWYYDLLPMTPARWKAIVGRLCSSAFLLLLLAGASSCTTSSSQTTSGRAFAAGQWVAPSANLTRAPIDCSARPLDQVSLRAAGVGNLVGRSPVWAGFYARPDTALGVYHLVAATKRTATGWRMKVLWVIDAKQTAAIEVQVTERRTRHLAKIELAGRRATPVTRARIDRSDVGVEQGGTAYRQFPSYLFLPHAGCYLVEVHAGNRGWRKIVGFGR